MTQQLQAERLNDESIQGWLRTRSGWKRRGDALVKLFSFDSFRNSIVFVNRVATLADAAQHHPDIDVRGPSVTVALSTHDAGGVTERDVALAEQIDFATSAG